MGESPDVGGGLRLILCSDRGARDHDEGREGESAARCCPEAFAEAPHFLGEFYACLSALRDEMFELVDAVLWSISWPNPCPVPAQGSELMSPFFTCLGEVLAR